MNDLLLFVCKTKESSSRTHTAVKTKLHDAEWRARSQLEQEVVMRTRREEVGLSAGGVLETSSLV